MVYLNHNICLMIVTNIIHVTIGIMIAILVVIIVIINVGSRTARSLSSQSVRKRLTHTGHTKQVPSLVNCERFTLISSSREKFCFK